MMRPNSKHVTEAETKWAKQFNLLGCIRETDLQRKSNKRNSCNNAKYKVN